MHISWDELFHFSDCANISVKYFILIVSIVVHHFQVLVMTSSVTYMQLMDGRDSHRSSPEAACVHLYNVCVVFSITRNRYNRFNQYNVSVSPVTFKHVVGAIRNRFFFAVKFEEEQ